MWINTCATIVSYRLLVPLQFFRGSTRCQEYCRHHRCCCFVPAHHRHRHRHRLPTRLLSGEQATTSSSPVETQRPFSDAERPRNKNKSVHSVVQLSRARSPKQGEGNAENLRLHVRAVSTCNVSLAREAHSTKEEPSYFAQVAGFCWFFVHCPAVVVYNCVMCGCAFVDDTDDVIVRSLQPYQKLTGHTLSAVRQ